MIRGWSGKTINNYFEFADCCAAAVPTTAIPPQANTISDINLPIGRNFAITQIAHHTDAIAAATSGVVSMPAIRAMRTTTSVEMEARL
jgi:hypothetical protein